METKILYEEHWMTKIDLFIHIFIHNYKTFFFCGIKFAFEFESYLFYVLQQI